MSRSGPESPVSEVPHPGAGRTIAAALARGGSRGPGFDTLRLSAAGLVMLHHAMTVEGDIVHDALFRFSGGYIHLGLLAVAVFFALSGFLVTPGLARSHDVIAYLSRRFMRIMPLLAIVVVTCAFVVGPMLTSLPLRDYFADPRTWLYLKNVTTSLSLDLPGVVNHGGTSGVNGPMWTLRYEWLCYLALAAAALLGLLRSRALFLAAWLAATGLLAIGYGPVAADADPGPGAAFMILFLFGYFGAGAVLALFADRIALSPLLLGAAFLALVGALAAGIGHVAAPPLVAYLVAGVGTVRFPWSGFMARRDLSYGIYLTHSVVLTVLVNLHPFRSGLLLFAVCLPLTCLVAWCTWTFVEEPALRRKDWPAQVLRRLLRMVSRASGPRPERSPPA